MGAVFIICSETKDYHSFIDNVRSNVKGRGRSTGGRWKVCDSECIFILSSPVPTHPIIPGFDRGLIELMRRALCDIFAASNSVWISYGGWWILYRQLVPHRAYFTLLCRTKSGKSTEYMEVQILDFLSAKMGQQPEDVDHLRCSPTKTLHWVAI